MAFFFFNITNSLHISMIKSVSPIFIDVLDYQLCVCVCVCKPVCQCYFYHFVRNKICL